MGAIKDIVDLAKDLESRAKDRHDMDIIHKIQSLAFALQSQYVDTMERDVKLVQENADLNRQLEEIKAEKIRFAHDVEFRKGPRTDGKWHPFCPKCHLPLAFDINGGSMVYCGDTKNCGWQSNKLVQDFRGYEGMGA